MRKICQSESLIDANMLVVPYASRTHLERSFPLSWLTYMSQVIMCQKDLDQKDS